jgi:hypothetical protein
VEEGGHWPLGDATAEQATVCAWQASETLIVNTSTRIEYDGMMRIGLTVMPQNKKRPKLGNLWLEVPLKRELTTLYHYYPGHWGDTANSDMLPEQGLALPFKAFVWLGNEDGGLGWFAESDQQWRPASADRAIEVVPRDDALILRVHLLDSEAPLPATSRSDYRRHGQTVAQRFQPVANLAWPPNWASASRCRRRNVVDLPPRVPGSRASAQIGPSPSVGRENRGVPRRLDAHSKLPRRGTGGIF